MGALPLLPGRTWTIDGAALNRLLYLVNIRDKYHVFGCGRATKRRPDGAFYRTGMDAPEIEAVLRDAMTELGVANVRTSNLRPVADRHYHRRSASTSPSTSATACTTSAT